MDQTYLIPYELLRHISSYLLPKYQCRFALTSRHCYQYLYTTLLRWHARKDSIPVPKHIIYEDIEVKKQLTVLVTQGRVLIIQADAGMYIQDLTSLHDTVLYMSGIGNSYYYSGNTIEPYYNCTHIFKQYRKFKILEGCYRYIHKKVLLGYINSLQPIQILYKKMHLIRYYLSASDMANLWIAGI